MGLAWWSRVGTLVHIILVSQYGRAWWGGRERCVCKCVYMRLECCCVCVFFCAVATHSSCVHLCSLISFFFEGIESDVEIGLELAGERGGGGGV
ncbi:hypothetical protein GGS21DRAFT_1483 [Xylaria nigripes]|nr:hypothetical protein GGS21DRAFT_1483 [Xylaria nigripes]